MRVALLNWFHDMASIWARKRFVLPALMVLAGGLLVVSELTYRDTTTTLRAGIALTDLRVQSQRLLQLLTDSESAEFGYLVTGNPRYLALHEKAKAELPQVQTAVMLFLSGQGPEGIEAAQQVSRFSTGKLVQIDRALALALSGDTEGAYALARNETGNLQTQAVRDVMTRELDRATAMQQQARVSLFDALLVNRLAVGLLTVASLLSLFLFIRQLLRQDARDRTERERLETEVTRRTARLNELALHFQTVREDERSRLARELHDELGALLTVTKLEIARVKSKADRADEVRLGLDRVIAAVDQGIALKRRIIEDLTPSSLAHLGLTIALQNLCETMRDSLGIPVECELVELSLTPQANLAVYRFVQEALTNIGKHASASLVRVSVQERGDHVRVEVGDDGSGFDSATQLPGRHGLSGMQFRVESLGGEFAVESSPEKGSTLRMDFPKAANWAASN